LLPLLIVFAAGALMSLSPACQAWLVNTWSVQYTHHVLRPEAKQSLLAVPSAGHARASLWLASDALRSGNPALAETLITLQAAQGDQLAMHLLADAFMAQGDFSGALATWQQAGDIVSLLQAASQAQQAGRPEDALLAYQAAWTLDPKSGTLPLVNFLIKSQKDYRTAEDILRKSLDSYPNSRDWSLWSNRLGDDLRSQGRWDDALKAYEKTIIRTPYDWAAYVGIGWIKYERGDGLQPAISEFQKVIDIPESNGNGQYAIAQVLTREKRFEEADVWFTQAIALDPKARGRYLTRANAARESGDLTLALAVYQETLKRFPDYTAAYYEIAYAYRLNKQPAQAISAIDGALLRMAPPDASYYARAGGIYEWAGDASRALEAYRQALRIDPQNAAALGGVERLEK
jgi:tetratricopeptide (TPR) repeat protein